MGERIDNLKESAKQAGTVAADASFGALDGLIIVAYPLLVMATVALIGVAIIKLPGRVFGGNE